MALILHGRHQPAIALMHAPLCRFQRQTLQSCIVTGTTHACTGTSGRRSVTHLPHPISPSQHLCITGSCLAPVGPLAWRPASLTSSLLILHAAGDTPPAEPPSSTRPPAHRRYTQLSGIAHPSPAFIAATPVAQLGRRPTSLPVCARILHIADGTAHTHPPSLPRAPAQR